MINTPQLSMSIVMEGETVDINSETKAGRETVIFQNIVRRRFEFSEAWVATSRLDHHLLA